MLRLSAAFFLAITAFLCNYSHQHYVYRYGGGALPWQYNPWVQSGIIPEVMFRQPPFVCAVMFNNSVAMKLGNELTPTQVQKPPTFMTWPCRYDRLHTLAFFDPDVPSRENNTLRSFQHWLVGNIPGCQIDKGDTLTQYIGSGPSPGSGFHRYMYLILAQPKRLDFDEPMVLNTTAEGRASFDIAAFVNKYQMSLLAGNFYHARYDDYVPTLYKQLGIA